MHQRLLQTPLIALPPGAIAPTHRRPRPIHPRAAAAEQQVVVELVLLSGGPPAADEGGGGAFDGEHDGAVVRCSEDVSAEPV